MVEKLLRVVSPDRRIVAGAIFEKRGPSWRLVRCAPILAWWYRIPYVDIVTWMTGPARKAGWTWTWH